MLNVSEEGLDFMEEKDPGIKQNILDIEAAELPACVRCGSEDTAKVSAGLVGRSMRIAGATTKFKLVANMTGQGQYFCNSCNEFFHLERKAEECR